MKITQDNNLMRIFRIPKDFPHDFCFGGGISVEFQMVDWFNPWQKIGVKSTEEMKAHKELIRDFTRGKVYFDSSYNYLALAEYGDAFLI